MKDRDLLQDERDALTQLIQLGASVRRDHYYGDWVVTMEGHAVQRAPTLIQILAYLSEKIRIDANLASQPEAEFTDVRDRLNGLVRQIEMICDASGLDPAEWLSGSQPEAAQEPVAWMWQHSETGNCGFIEHSSDADRAHWERMNKPRKIIAPLYTRPAAQEGWRLVPVEPTKEQLQAMHDGPLMGSEYNMDQRTEDYLREMYKAGIAAAPQPKGGERE